MIILTIKSYYVIGGHILDLLGRRWFNCLGGAYPPRYLTERGRLWVICESQALHVVVYAIIVRVNPSLRKLLDFFRSAGNWKFRRCRGDSRQSAAKLPDAGASEEPRADHLL